MLQCPFDLNISRFEFWEELGVVSGGDPRVWPCPRSRAVLGYISGIYLTHNKD